MLRIGVLVSGGGTNLQAVIDKIESGYINNAEIVTVVTNRKNAYALQRAKDHGIDSAIIRPMDYKDQEGFCDGLITHFDVLKVDLIVLAGYLVILPDGFIAHFSDRIINVHPALIPAFSGKGFYGLHVHAAALERGVKLSGATVHFVNEVTDGGPIILQKPVQVLESDTVESLQKRIMEEAEWVVLPEAIKLIANKQVSVIDNKVQIKLDS
jgi:phosphoribosylglycinamide formyltransferase-1